MQRTISRMLLVLNLNATPNPIPSSRWCRILHIPFRNISLQQMCTSCANSHIAKSLFVFLFHQMCDSRFFWLKHAFWCVIVNHFTHTHTHSHILCAFTNKDDSSWHTTTLAPGDTIYEVKLHKIIQPVAPKQICENVFSTHIGHLALSCLLFLSLRPHILPPRSSIHL